MTKGRKEREEEPEVLILCDLCELLFKSAISFTEEEG